MVEKIKIQEIQLKNRHMIDNLISENWGSEIIVSKGKVHRVSDLPGYIAVYNNEVVGIISYNIEDNNVEIIVLESFKEGQGIGTLLIDKVKEKAKELNKKRIWLITSNDNINALRFYQKRGFTLVCIHRNAIDKAREIKPEIPKTGYHGIPIRDEIELEYIIKE